MPHGSSIHASRDYSWHRTTRCSDAVTFSVATRTTSVAKVAISQPIIRSFTTSFQKGVVTTHDSPIPTRTDSRTEVI
ncbi:hypothetical protein K503DRAFT_167295 [Rhizopogon vinicolor AM-OR11-026]|uniref:Uncharacterized protein n=1 Tax=Rhizopogon vinicolor AM-OR11-026 TaxID=1314800 RepID=A0A1B7NEX4_9AGAM|nr:hypothetical protein K503DRAFT_167295 [Rhizopogon vinicolor AM-OR11-026]